MVRAAHRLAMASDHITADMVGISEFPQLAVKYSVQSVPVVIINEEHRKDGSVSENELVREILKAIGR